MKMDGAKVITFFLLRVVTGLLFFHAGSVKTLGWFGGMPDHPGQAAPLMSQIGIGGVLDGAGDPFPNHRAHASADEGILHRAYHHGTSIHLAARVDDRILQASVRLRLPET